MTALPPGELSVPAARRAVAATLRAGGFDTPELDARILVGHALGLAHAALAAENRLLSPDECSSIAALLQRRLAHEPVARIVGDKEFWGLSLAVDGDVLVPRPDTETLVEAVLVAIDSAGGRTRAWRIADLGTGSGAILIALLKELPHAFGVGTDISARALAVARRNAKRHGVGTRATFIAGDLSEALAPGFDIVVSNPPYIPSDDIAGLAPDVRCFDPIIALDGGADGLNAYRRIASDVRRILRPGGLIACEIGIAQAEHATQILAEGGIDVAPAQADLAGIPRVLCGRNP
jgi:release factor glutamine methyltransferase